MVFGHENIKNTLVYIQLVNFESDDYIAKVARSCGEACQLIETGFECVTEIDGVKSSEKKIARKTHD